MDREANAHNPHVRTPLRRRSVASAGYEEKECTSLFQKMAHNPYTGFIQHSVCMNHCKDHSGVILLPTAMSLGFAAMPPVLRRHAIPRLACYAGSGGVSADLAPSFAQLHLSWDELREQQNLRGGTDAEDVEN